MRHHPENETEGRLCWFDAHTVHMILHNLLNIIFETTGKLATHETQVCFIQACLCTVLKHVLCCNLSGKTVNYKSNEMSQDTEI